MDFHFDLWQMLSHAPTILGLFAAALAGERSAHKLLIAACQTVYLLAGDELSTSEKRSKAIDMVCHQFPKLTTFVPRWMLGKLVDIAWEQVIKPTVGAPQGDATGG